MLCCHWSKRRSIGSNKCQWEVTQIVTIASVLLYHLPHDLYLINFVAATKKKNHTCVWNGRLVCVERDERRHWRNQWVKRCRLTHYPVRSRVSRLVKRVDYPFFWHFPAVVPLRVETPLLKHPFWNTQLCKDWAFCLLGCTGVDCH